MEAQGTLSFLLLVAGMWTFVNSQQCEILPETFALCTTYDTQWDGVRLYLYPRKDIDRIQSFDAGEAFCRKYNATLVSIRSIAENQFLQNWLYNLGITIWIGLSRTLSVPFDEWEWTDGSPVDFTQWYEPPQFGDDCAYFAPRANPARWFAEKCDKTLDIVCQIKYVSS
jgi:hypothetical protein